ncbi:hypothetical protein ACWGST_12705 [Agromyces sp. NPDC055520]
MTVKTSRWAPVVLAVRRLDLAEPAARTRPQEPATPARPQA